MLRDDLARREHGESGAVAVEDPPDEPVGDRVNDVRERVYDEVHVREPAEHVLHPGELPLHLRGLRLDQLQGVAARKSRGAALPVYLGRHLLDRAELGDQIELELVHVGAFRTNCKRSTIERRDGRPPTTQLYAKRVNCSNNGFN
jgi:hypothetical protein